VIAIALLISKRYLAIGSPFSRNEPGVHSFSNLFSVNPVTAARHLSRKGKQDQDDWVTASVQTYQAIPDEITWNPLAYSLPPTPAPKPSHRYGAGLIAGCAGPTFSLPAVGSGDLRLPREETAGRLGPGTGLLPAPGDAGRVASPTALDRNVPVTSDKDDSFSGSRTTPGTLHVGCTGMFNDLLARRA
jgi:hypothetical protein